LKVLTNSNYRLSLLFFITFAWSLLIPSLLILYHRFNQNEMSFQLNCDHPEKY